MHDPGEYYTETLGKSEFTIHKRYQDLQPIGRGAYGLVASATDSVTGRKVAIKRISRVFQNAIDAKRIVREVKIMRFLGEHDNIVQLYDLMTAPPEVC